MKVCGYNVLPIVTDPLNLYNVVRSGTASKGWASLGQAGRGKG